MDWVLFGVIAGPAFACVIAFVLGACWQAGKDDQSARVIEQIEAERMIRHAEHRPCPWDLKP